MKTVCKICLNCSNQHKSIVSCIVPQNIDPDLQCTSNRLNIIEYAIVLYNEFKTNKKLRLIYFDIINKLSVHKYSRHPIIICYLLNLYELYNIMKLVKCNYSVNTEYNINSLCKTNYTCCSYKELVMICDSYMLLLINNIEQMEKYITYINDENSITLSLMYASNKLNRENVRPIIKSLSRINRLKIIFDYELLNELNEEQINDDIDVYYYIFIGKYMTVVYFIKQNKYTDTAKICETLISLLDINEHIGLNMLKIMLKYKVNFVLLPHVANKHYLPKVIREYYIYAKDRIDEQDNDGNTFIHRLVKYNDKDMLEDMFKLNICSMNIKNTNGMTPLILSAFEQSNQCLEYLLETMRDTDNETDNDGNTVYHYITRNNLMINSKIKKYINPINEKYPLDMEYTVRGLCWEYI